MNTANDQNPYAIPQMANSINPAQADLQFHFQHLGGLTTVLSVLLGLGLVVEIATAWSSLLQYDLLTRMHNGGQFTAAEADANDSRVGLIAIAALLLFLVTIVTFAIWISKSHKNLYALKVPNLTFTPGWAVGWYFIPILNLIRPYQSMKELWHASHHGPNWVKTAPASLVGAWWALWLLNSVYGHISTQINEDVLIDVAPTLEDLIFATQVEMATIIFAARLHVFAFVLVRRINRAQQAFDFDALNASPGY